jgi:hypothetical protein
MSDLSKILQHMIGDLEKLRDSHNPPDERILGFLDSMYEYKTRLIGAAIDAAAPKYQLVISSLQEAGVKTREAIADLAQLEHALQKIGKALGKIADLIA